MVATIKLAHYRISTSRDNRKLLLRTSAVAAAGERGLDGDALG